MRENLPYWRQKIGVAREKTMKSVDKADWAYEKLEASFAKIEYFFEGENNIYYRLSKHLFILDKFEDLRTEIWAFCSYIDTLTKMEVELEKFMDVLLSLQDNGFDSIAENLEGITDEGSRKQKCLIARTSLEKLVKEILEKSNIEVKQGFYLNLSGIAKLNIISKQEYKAMGAHYSFISQIVHGEREDGLADTAYALNGIYSHIKRISMQYMEWQKKTESKN